MPEGRPLDWDMTSAPTGDSVQTLLVPGVYPFRVVKFERLRYGGGSKIGPCPMAKITIEIDGIDSKTGQQGTALCSEDLKLWDSDFQRRLIGNFFAAIGSPRDDSGAVVVDWNIPLVGCSGWVETDLRTYEANGETRRTNDIKRWVPPEQAPKPAAASEPAQPYQQPAQVAYDPAVQVAYDPAFQASVNQAFGYAQPAQPYQQPAQGFGAR